MESGPIIWTPSEQERQASNLAAFRELLNTRHGVRCPDYPSLHRWSIENVPPFWALVWDFVGIRASAQWRRVVDDSRRMPGARWFEGARLNFAENLLRRRDEGPAIIARGEFARATRRLSWNELHRAVARAARALRAEGVRPGDRVAGYLPNAPETVIAMLAAAAVGATWSSCSPDFGVRGVLDRFQRIAPRVLITADGYSYGGKPFDSLANVAQILSELPAAPRVVVVPFLREQPDLSPVPGALAWDQWLGPDDHPELQFEQLPFDHPLYIMYSSGTTGLPKCIVQSAGGVLINQLKEHALHVDLRRDDRIFYYTTCGWMMWNWLVAALGVGATILLFDGSPFHPDALALPRFAEEEQCAVFGASAKYFSAMEKAGVSPHQHFALAPLRSILSTGSPLLDESFDFLAKEFRPGIRISSISGGTDLNGCFVAGSPDLPVRRGEIQCRCLGMDVVALDDAGREIIGETGELVCRQAFPSMPIRFFGDDSGSAYRAAYFERFPGLWCHGDFCLITAEGGVRITGRSDATLNPGGVRIGTAEIYRQVETLPEVGDSLVIAQEWEGDVRVVLFVRPAPGHMLDEAMRRKIRESIRRNCTPRHVPAKIIAVADIPYTISGKKVELAVREVVHGRPVRNREALKNPEALNLYRDLPELALA